MMSELNRFQSDQVVAKLQKWATERASIRAMLLTSTRANPHAIVDPLSDYDIILVVDDIRSYYQDRIWLDNFGEVLVTYWDPIYQSPETGIEILGNVVQ
jgi:Streptomycin adenylyltransferase